MWWWMSFTDPDLPEGEQFLGVVLMNAESPEEALTGSWLLGLNPGGEVAMVPFAPEDAPEGFELRERFLTPSEARSWA